MALCRVNRLPKRLGCEVPPIGGQEWAKLVEQVGLWLKADVLGLRGGHLGGQAA